MPEFFKQCCETVQKMHEKPYWIMHRDLSPYHILVDDNHKLKISGFGLSKYMGYYDYASDVVGAIDYRAPEVDKGKYRNIADFWSLCVTFIEAVSGY